MPPKTRFSCWIQIFTFSLNPVSFTCLFPLTESLVVFSCLAAKACKLTQRGDDEWRWIYPTSPC